MGGSLFVEGRERRERMGRASRADFEPAAPTLLMMASLKQSNND